MSAISHGEVPCEALHGCLGGHCKTQNELCAVNSHYLVGRRERCEGLLRRSLCVLEVCGSRHCTNSTPCVLCGEGSWLLL